MDCCLVNNGAAKSFNSGSSSSSPATPTRGIGRFGTPRTVFSPTASYSLVKPTIEKVVDLQLPAAARNGDGETCCSSVLLKSMRPLLENLAKRLADGQHKPTLKVQVVPDAPDVKRPGIGRFGGKPAAAVLAPVVVTAAPFTPSATAAVTPSAVVAPVVVPEVAPVAPVASTTPQVPEACVTTEAKFEETNACAADPSEKARWDKLRQEVRAMDCDWVKKLRARAAYLRWAKLDQATWARDIEAAIEASLPAWIVPGKTVPPASATAATVAMSTAPAAPSTAAATTVKPPAAASAMRGAAPATQESSPAVTASCKVGGATAKRRNGCSSQAVSTGVKGGKGSSTHSGASPCAAVAQKPRPAPRGAATAAVVGSRGAASSVGAAGKASSGHASGVKRRDEDVCAEGAAEKAAGGRQGGVKAAGGRQGGVKAAGGRQGGVKAAGGRAVASDVCGREGFKQQVGRREGLVHEMQARPGCSSSRAHRRSS
ncbi:unnamed protein product [Closterium sp. NIES-53]